MENNKSICKIYSDGTKNWFRDGKLHREDGPAIECTDGEKRWYRDDKVHREDGPAVELTSGDKYWCRNDKVHREDGPAVELANGTKYWYYRGMEINCSNQQQFKKILKMKAFW